MPIICSYNIAISWSEILKIELTNSILLMNFYVKAKFNSLWANTNIILIGYEHTRLPNRSFSITLWKKKDFRNNQLRIIDILSKRKCRKENRINTISIFTIVTTWVHRKIYASYLRNWCLNIVHGTIEKGIQFIILLTDSKRPF